MAALDAWIRTIRDSDGTLLDDGIVSVATEAALVAVRTLLREEGAALNGDARSAACELLEMAPDVTLDYLSTEWPAGAVEQLTARELSTIKREYLDCLRREWAR